MSHHYVPGRLAQASLSIAADVCDKRSGEILRGPHGQTIAADVLDWVGRDLPADTLLPVSFLADLANTLRRGE